MRKKAKKILASAALIMSLCMFTACGNTNNAADEVDTTEDENITDENDMNDTDNNTADDNTANNTEQDRGNNTNTRNNDEISTDNGTVVEDNNGTGNGAADGKKTARNRKREHTEGKRMLRESRRQWKQGRHLTSPACRHPLRPDLPPHRCRRGKRADARMRR